MMGRMVQLGGKGSARVDAGVYKGLRAALPTATVKRRTQIMTKIMRYAVWTLYSDGGDVASWMEAIFFVEAPNEGAAAAHIEREHPGVRVLSMRTATELRQLAAQLERERPDLQC